MPERTSKSTGVELDPSGAGRADGIARYHERTKHHPHRYAPGPGGLDWANEPDPFRRYRGASRLALDHPSPDDAPGPAYDDLFRPGKIAARPIDRTTASLLLFDSLALSAWKEHRGARWSLRVNPSSGDLHPTEGYVVTGGVAGLHEGAGVLHYCPLDHALELRRRLDDELWRELTRGLPAPTLLVGLTSIDWRESWKYGERALRYCELDLGHAIAAVALGAAGLGWQARLLETVDDDGVARLLGVRRQRGPEAERPAALLAVSGCDPDKSAWDRLREFRPDGALMRRIGGGRWLGRRNRLSAEHRRWPLLEAGRVAARKREIADPASWSPPPPRAQREDAAPRPVPARRVIRQRRSALDLDGTTGISRADFHRMLRRTLREVSNPALAALPWRPAVHLLLFVHRVEGLARGLYLLVRDPAQLDRLRSSLSGSLDWERPAETPRDLELYRLRAGDARDVARLASCHQAIAADGAFAAAMLAEFEPRLAAHGDWFYRRLHWEAGAIGQVLYLEAEAAGIRATGIGCYFDDVTHGLVGLARGDLTYRTVYHFTLGGPVDDPRLTSLPAYPPPRGI